jgi:hypothetical protein
MAVPSFPEDELSKVFPLEKQDQMVRYNFMKRYINKSFDINNHFHFTIPYNNQYGTDLTNCYVELECQVLKKNGQKLDENDQKIIQPCCDFFDALFSSLTVRINGADVGCSVIDYPQLALVQTLLSNSEECREKVIFGVLEHVVTVIF